MVDWRHDSCKDCIHARPHPFGLYCELHHIVVGESDVCTDFKRRDTS